MYAGVRAIDWGQIINTGIQTVGQVVSRATGGRTVYYPPSTPGYPGYPPTVPQAGMSLTTVALLGLGVFLLVRMSKR